ncbi:MAG: hypothetical protein RJB38_2008 [Pseudomonadota bacterium]|jgi:negative regulator of flagellin synthesis FlgM
MKVSSNNTSQSIQNRAATSASESSAAKRSEKADASQSAAARRVDSGATKAEISSKAKDLAKAKEVAGQAPDVREDKIAELKARIAAGKYEVNAQAVADRLVDEHLSSGIG